MNEIRANIRNLIGDNSDTMSDVFTYTTSSIFTLTEVNPISILAVYRNDVESNVTYSYNATTKKVTITSALSSGDTVQIDYSYYPNYSETELTNYVKSALVYLSTMNYYTFIYDTEDDAIYPPPSDKENNLIALITSILISPNNVAIRLPDISITASDNLSITEKLNKILASFKRDTHGIFGII